jgi:hypothetical protein
VLDFTSSPANISFQLTDPVAMNTVNWILEMGGMVIVITASEWRRFTADN